MYTHNTASAFVRMCMAMVMYGWRWEKGGRAACTSAAASMSPAVAAVVI